MGFSENEFKEIKDQFLQTAKQELGGSEDAEKKAQALMDSYLAQDAIAYILRQLNQIARLGVLDMGQYKLMMSEAETGLFLLIYVKHYKEREDLVDKDPVWISCRNLLRNLFSRVLHGRDRELYEKELESRRPIVMQQR
jgi:hypothetical protein